jgi:hypothetical protein
MFHSTLSRDAPPMMRPAHGGGEAICFPTGYSIIETRNPIENQDSMANTTCANGSPIMPARIQVLIFGKGQFFEVVRQRLSKLNLQLLQCRFAVWLRGETVLGS